MLSKYNRLRQGYKRLKPKYRQKWINLNTNIPFEEAYTYIEEGSILNEIKHISMLLDKFKVATYDQIKKYLEFNGCSMRNLDFNELVKLGILNNFIIGLEGATDITEDEIFYSIGVNASLFLRKVLNLPVTRMLVKDISLSPMILVNRLDLVDFYLNYINSYGLDNVLSFEINPLKRVLGDIINIDAEMIVNKNGKKIDVIILNANYINVDTTIPKTIVKLERLLQSNRVRCFLMNDGEDTELLLLCENEDLIEYVGKKMKVTTFRKKDKLNMLSVGYIIRTNLSEYNIAYSVDEEGNIVEKQLLAEV